MATITEDYVSFETAKLLKKKGFDEYCSLWYNLDKPIEGPFFYKEIGWYGHNSYDYNGKRIISAPTLQMAMKWLREAHGLFISIGNDDLNYSWQIFDIKNRTKDLDPYCLTDSYGGYRKYEQACEAAIKYCAKHLI